MRLSPKYVEEFKNYFNQLIDTKHEVFLFGSRTDDAKKGGDIDLLVVVDEEILVEKLKSSAAKIRIKLRELSGDQRVDVVFTTSSNLKIDPFLKSIRNKIRL